MTSINERLDQLRKLIQEQDFLEGNGLSNEVNIRIFCYDAADEMAVQHFVKQIKTDQSLTCKIIEKNLYKVFLAICKKLDILDSIEEMESADGTKSTLAELQNTITVDEFIEEMQYAPHQKGDVIIITGIGDVFPFMRAHILLNAMQPYFSNVPIIALYPGEFDGYHLKLFSRLQPNDYYRGFNII